MNSKTHTAMEFQWDDQAVMDFTNGLASMYPRSEVLERMQVFKAMRKPKPEWEILSYIYNRGISDMPDPIVKPNSGHWNYAVVANYPIHSVKRLSDGEIFAVGETVKAIGLANPAKITGFRIQGGMEAMVEGYKYGICLMYLSKLSEKGKDWEILKWTCVKEKCPLDYPIHSVKRLSDGEVFTVGERVHHKNCTELIDGFEIRGTELWANFKEQGPLPLTDLVKAPKITFGPDVSLKEREWKEVKQRGDEMAAEARKMKGWEIIQGEDVETGLIHQWYSKPDPIEHKTCLEKKCKIHSVRRSDGEAFRVGGRVRDKLGNYGFIKSMNVEADSFYVHLDSAENKSYWMTLYLKDLINGWVPKTWQDHLDALAHNISESRPRRPPKPIYRSEMPPVANGKVPVWLTPEEEGKLRRLLALFDPMAGAVKNPKP